MGGQWLSKLHQIGRRWVQRRSVAGMGHTRACGAVVVGSYGPHGPWWVPAPTSHPPNERSTWRVVVEIPPDRKVVGAGLFDGRSGSYQDVRCGGVRSLRPTWAMVGRRSAASAARGRGVNEVRWSQRTQDYATDAMTILVRRHRAVGRRRPPRTMRAPTTGHHRTAHHGMTHVDYQAALHPPPSDLVEFQPPPATDQRPPPHPRSAPEPCEERVYTKERRLSQSGSVI